MNGNTFSVPMAVPAISFGNSSLAAVIPMVPIAFDVSPRKKKTVQRAA